MIRVTTLYASGAGASAEYYTGYLTKADGEQPGVWTGSQASGLGLSGEVTTKELEALLSGHHPSTGQRLGRALIDRVDKHGNTIKAVAGYDATLSAPKSLSVLWGLTGDEGLAECHDVAVNAVVEMVEKYGSTTRIRSNGTRLHPETNGLTVAVFRQSTSRADDPQLHTHVVISSKVQTHNGRWYALDALTLKKYQQAFGYLYQSVLRAELSHRYGIVFDDIVNGQAEISGVPSELLEKFSKRSGEIAVEMNGKLAVFKNREGRDPTDFEHAAMEREAAVDTRTKKSGACVPDLRTRWHDEAAGLGVDATTLTNSISEAASQRPIEASPVAVSDVIDELATKRSTWNRMDVLRAICDTASPQPGHAGASWAAALGQSVDTVLTSCVDLDPASDNTLRRSSDGRSLWIEPITNQSTSSHVIAQEEHILSWAVDAQADDPARSHTIADDALDDGQHDAAAAVAGHDRLVLVVGPAGAGKTRMLQAAVRDLQAQTRSVIGFAPTAKAARVLEIETGMATDTVAKLLYELGRPSPDRSWRGCGPGTTVIVDETGMLKTTDLHQLITHAGQRRWRLALIGDPHQLQAVGRGGMFQELCDNGRTIELEHLHRFTNPWEAAASLRLREGDPRALETYASFDRIRPGTFEEHLYTISEQWKRSRNDGETISITTGRNEHVHAINHHMQQCRIGAGELDQNTLTPINDDWAMIGDIVATRRNDRRLRTTSSEPIRNRERWTITDANPNGDITVARLDGPGTITLPADYVRQHVQLAYATTEHGAQGETADRSITLATTATTGRGLYVGMTRGRQENVALVVTDTLDLTEATSILEAAIAIDRADIPATAHRRTLAAPGTVRPQPRTQVPDWFDDLRAQADERCQIAQGELDERNAERSAQEMLGVEAQHGLQAAEAAHAPFEKSIKAGDCAVNEARSELWSAEYNLRTSGRVHRRSARRRVETATDVLATAEARLVRVEKLSSSSRASLADCRQIIDDQQQFDLTSRILDRWDDVGDAAKRADGLCDALDQWMDWANGRAVGPAVLVEIAATLEDHPDLPGAGPLGESLTHWAAAQGVELQRPRPPRPSIEMSIDL